MKTTRERIIQMLLKNPRSSINDLADEVGINAISVRHHLTNLQRDGLVNAEEERHGVGRPRLVYNLTEKGLEQFPTSYLKLTNRLLDQMKEKLGEQTIRNMFDDIAKDLASEYTKKGLTLPMEQKLDLVKELLRQEGFSVEWESDGNKYYIHEITCPYYHISQSHPEVCQIDQSLISSVLAVPAEKIKCVLRGDKHCTYIIPKQNQMERVE